MAFRPRRRQAVRASCALKAGVRRIRFAAFRGSRRKRTSKRPYAETLGPTVALPEPDTVTVTEPLTGEKVTIGAAEAACCAIA